MTYMTIPRFWREISSRYNLVGSRCPQCKKIYFPPRTICMTCHRRSLGKMERLKLGGEGTVVSYTVVHEAPEALEMQKPYILAIIEMDEGPRVTAQLIDCDLDMAAIGLKVKSTFRKLHEEGDGGIIHYGYKFRPIVNPR
jgi:uncharacterized OB-fold protein